MDQDKIETTVIVCAYTLERWGDLEASIKGLQNQTKKPSEVILVIDHNPDLYEKASKAFPTVKVIENQQERGLSGARNTGVAISTGDVIAFIDEDAVASPDWLEKLTSTFQNPEVISVGGQVRPKWDEATPSWFPEEFYWVVGSSYKGLPETPAPIRNPIGCNMSFRREALVKAGGFRHGIGRIGKTPVGCEETELSIRVKQQNPNSVILYQPEAVVYHRVPAWRATLKYFLQRSYAEGLSKALVTQYVGSNDGLASEWQYTLRTLPSGVLSGIKQSVADGNLEGFNRAVAIILGLSFTTAGYLVGKFSKYKSDLLPAMNKFKVDVQNQARSFVQHLRTSNRGGIIFERKEMQNLNNHNEVNLDYYQPAKVLDIELSHSLPAVSCTSDDGQKTYHHSLILARLHTYPLGLLSMDFIDHEISPQQLADKLWEKLGTEINQHLIEDGLDPISSLPVEGLKIHSRAKCLKQRDEILKDAPLISIVIASRDRATSLKTTFKSFLALDYPNFEVILVDNAPSSDETHELFKRYEEKFSRKNISFRYVREDTPGLAVAHNRGLELVRGPIVAFTDDDVVVDKYWLAGILRGFKAASSVGCVTGPVIPVELETPAQVLFEEYGGFQKGLQQKIFDMGSYRPDHPLYPYSPGHFGTGANMAYSTDSLRKSGGFDSALGIGTPALGADDLSTFLQIILNGYQLVYQPYAMVFHQHRRNYESLRKQMFGYGTGLTVFLTKCLVDNPRLLFDLAPKIPTGIQYAFSPSSPKNSTKSKNYPHELEVLERKGMLYGPLAYFKSRWHYRKIKHNEHEKGLVIESSAGNPYLVNEVVQDYQGENKRKEL